MSLSFLILAAAAVQAAPPREPDPALPLASAQAAVEGCLAYAASRRFALTVAVVDHRGDLVAFAQMDRAPSKAAELARLKADTAATLPFTPVELRPIVFADPERPHGIERVPGVVIFDGAARLVTAEGVKVGAIGVSGATAAEDRACADAGVAAFEGGRPRQ